MADIVWINGQIVPLSEARVGVEDRGLNFADGVYEVFRLYGGRVFTMEEHLDRLEASAGGIQLEVPLSRQTLRHEIQRRVAQSQVADGMVYLQLTRGASPRNHLFPGGLRGAMPAGSYTAGPTMFFFARGLPALAPPGESAAVRLISYPEERWKRCWIKSIALLPNVLAKNAAIAAGADEAAFVEDALVWECSTSNLLAVIRGKLVTPPTGPKVLPGITRKVLIECARELGIGVEERPMLAEEAKSADELFITSTTREISPVSHWDGQSVRGEVNGPVMLRLHRALRGRVG